MISTFIKDFKNSFYYKDIFAKDTSNSILGIYIVGSTCLGLDDQDSDYDIVILTNGGEHISEADSFYIRYKGKKVHWWYFPAEDLFKLARKDLCTLTPVQIYSFLSPKFVIYENVLYKDALQFLYKTSYSISKLNWYKLYDDHKKVINNIIKQGYIEQRYYYYKYIYHLCVATYNLYNKSFDIDYLKELKCLCKKPISEQVKNRAVQDLVAGVSYITDNPIDYKTELLTLYNKFSILLNRNG